MKNDFVTDDGKVKIFGTLVGERLKFRVYSRKWDIISYGFVEHTPLLICKEAWGAMLAERWEQVHATRLNRFRTDGDLAMDKLYRYYMLSRRRQCSRAVSAFETIRYHRFHKITNNPDKQKKKLDRLREMKPKFYCLNDDQRGHSDEVVEGIVKRFLEDYYPEPSSFEK